MITTMNALESLKPGAEWLLTDDKLEWLDTKQTEPTQEEIDAEIKRLQDDFDKKQYQRDRQSDGYPSIGDQLDMQYWDQVNGTTTWKDAIAKVKADHPKP